MDVLHGHLEIVHGRPPWTIIIDDLSGRLYRLLETSLIKCSIIVHVHYPFLGDSWPKLLC